MTASDETLILGRVGPVIESIGGEGIVRLGRQREVITSSAHGRFHEPAANNVLFLASTAAAGVAPGTVLSTTPPMALWNPPGSGKLLSVTRVTLAYVSGTLGAGFMGHAVALNQGTVPTGGAELTVQPGQLGATRSRSRAFQGSTLAATPALVRPSFSMGPALATTAVFPFLPTDEVDGELVVPPGVVYVFQGVALGAGTTPLVAIGVAFEEVDIPV